MVCQPIQAGGNFKFQIWNLRTEGNLALRFRILNSELGTLDLGVWTLDFGLLQDHRQRNDRRRRRKRTARKFTLPMSLRGALGQQRIRGSLQGRLNPFRAHPSSFIHPAGHSRPAARISGRSSLIIWAKISRETCCVPSLQASAGLGCTSMSKASAPMATAPLHIALTRSARPAPWLGSITIGQCDSCLMIGMVERSKV